MGTSGKEQHRMHVAPVIRAIPSVFRAPGRTFTPLARVLVGVAVLQAVLAVVVALVWLPGYRDLIQEDEGLENLSAVWWLGAAAAALTALALPSVRRHRSPLFYGLAAVFFIACGGEEISWGQRIFGFATPETLDEINKQDETNLHNIGSTSVFWTSFFLLTLFVFILWPALLRVNARAARFAERRRLPAVTHAASLIYAIWICAWSVVGIRYGTLGSHPFSLWGYYTQLDDELFEYGSAFAYFCLVLLDIDRVRRSNASAG
jgi:hypothetical protein